MARDLLSDYRKNLRKITIGNINFSKLVNVFLVADLEISFFNRLYLGNGAGWTNPNGQ